MNPDNLGPFCAECGKNLAGGPPGPGATLHADCLYCETRPHGPVKRTREEK